MAKDPTDFRKRFKAYKEGKMPYENGLPKYDDGRKPLSYWDNKQSTAYDIPFIPEKQIKLTDAGLATGAVLSTNLLDSIADNAYAAGLPIETALGLAVKESTLGNPTDDSSVRHILNSARYATFKELGTGLHIYKGERALNGLEIINYHKGDNDFGTRYINTGDYKKPIESKNQSILKTGFEFYKENPDRYNPGQKNYSELVNKRGREVVNSPEVKKWRKEWNDRKIKIMRPKPYKINTTIQNTATPKFGSWKNGKLPEYEDGKTPKDKRARSLYNAIDPRDAYPESYIDAARKEIKVRHKMYFGDPDKLEYELGEDLPSRVSDAAWRKRLGYDYDNTLLIPNGTGFRLPKELELEIPTDTTMLKDRINRTKELMLYSRKYRSNKYIKEALLRDLEALNALRYTYSTGMPATINEHAYNSRQWVSGGEVSPTMSPLNVLQNYIILYNKKDNTMKYKDVYDFNEFDWAIPGTPFTIEGTLNLPKYSDGKSPIHIKPANRGKFTALKKRTGHSASWFKAHGTPAQKKMAVFALNSRKWKH